MSSVHRNYALGSRQPHPASYVVCSYTTPDSYDAPFPWRFNKQTQTIDLEYVNGFNETTSLNDTPLYMRGHSLRSNHNVLGLGSNFIRWVENSLNADVGSVTMTERPIICDANMVCINQDPNSGGTNSSSDPITFEQSAGTAESGYLKTMVFLKPLVIRYTISGSPNYRYFTNNFEGNT